MQEMDDEEERKCNVVTLIYPQVIQGGQARWAGVDGMTTVTDGSWVASMRTE